MLSSEQATVIDALCLRDGGWASVTADRTVERDTRLRSPATTGLEVNTGHGRRYLVDLAGYWCVLTYGTLEWIKPQALLDEVYA